ncbi:RNA-directed DNA polymerase, eukaryota [Tanacetum coccineum]|uniref:RNA-directed DNA polymerase, eukaryota n=1 Tax=Tanacetum coccineum TaxID=301880 RepID=A0ABQ4XJE7_9ASTR
MEPHDSRSSKSSSIQHCHEHGVSFPELPSIQNRPNLQDLEVVFISTFPDDCSSRDLWKVCNGYGTVVDVFIPNKRSKAGKRFAFVRFINVLNLDRLIENLKTIWIGRFHLSANTARFERPKASTFQKEKPVPSGNVTGFKQPIVQNQGGPKESYSSILKPSLVLDDSCLVNRDLTNCVMGEVLQFSSINNLQVLLSNEGFHNTRVVYLGGLWVMIELKSSKSKSKFMKHVGVASWFRRLCNAQSDFAAKERIVWVDIEGVPLNAWTRSTFQKISSKWGELVELEDGYDDLFARKRICIKTSQTENILESFKLIVKGKVFWARAKELFVWSPSFKDVPEKELFSDDESAKINEQANNLNNDEVENASEVVSDTYFGDNGEVQGFEHQHGESNDKEVSSDPFNIYDLLDKRTKEVRTTDTSTSIPYPPGFTPANDIPACNNQDIPEAESVRPPSRSARSNSRVLEEAENSVDRVSSESFSNGVKIKEGGSILEILEEMITVGQTMGFSMEGLGSKAKKDWIKELISKHKVSFLSIQETKMESVSAMEVKFLWGNYFFDHIISEASGNSGGILCAWDTNFFKKDHHTISDNFIALYGTWIPNNQKLLIISVYAPQSVSSKRMLWSYLESLITSWNGESLIMGDFNEVRCIEERWGSVFNSHGANAFNSFISNSGLNDIQLEGFSFTWAHPSATKMSKLDRFLMSNGLLSAFPLISAICLDRHLSDHRPILLKEVFSDFGPTPFRFYHSWLELPGFDDLVSKSWNSFTLDDSNGMIRFKKKLQMLKKEIRAWTLDFKRHQVGLSKDLKSKLCDIDKVLDQGGVTDDILLSRLEVLKQLHDVQSSNNRDIMQKVKIRHGDWIVELILLNRVLEGTFKDRFPRPVLDEISSSDCSDALLLIDRGFLDGHFIINGLVFLSWLYWISALFSLTIRRLRVSSWCRYPDNCGAEAAMSIDSWVKCPKVLASKKLGGLGVSRSLTCLNGHVLSDAFNSHGGSIITEVTPLKSKVEDLISLVEFVCGKMVTGTSLLMVLGLKWRWCFSSKVVDLLLDEAFSLQWKFLLGWIKSMFASCLWLVLLCDHVLRDSSHLSSVSLCGERVFIS